MKKNTTQRLANYSALAFALFSAEDVNGQIVYTDIEDFTTNSGNYFLDLNNDGIFEFTIDGNSSSVIIFDDNSDNTFVGNNNFADALSENFDINDTATFNSQFSYANLVRIYFDSTYSNGNSTFPLFSCYGDWCDVTDRYIGLRFNINGSDHYGWVRLDLSFDSNNSGAEWTIKDYAYNDTPGDSILAGETETLDLEDIAINNVRVVALNKTIGIYNLPLQTTYRLFDITGKQVMKGLTDQNIHTIEASTLSDGIFILEIVDTNSKAVIKKKVIL
jgi:hypothetical protein